MRPISLITALLVAATLLYWFELRHAEWGGDEAVSVRSTPAVSAPPDAAAATSAVAGETAGLADAPAQAGDQPVPVVVLNSTARETSARLVLRGRTEARRAVEVAAETSGRVVSEPLRRGAMVSAGQVLCRLDPGIRDAELAEAEAVVTEAQAEASAATTLEAKGFAAETALKARQAQLRAAQARLDRVSWDIDRLEIRAPFDGILETDTAELGALLVPGSTCAEIIDLGEVKVEAYVSEQEVDQLRLGQPAQARLINGATAMGEVTFIGRMADDETRTFAVEVTLPNPDGSIRAGMTAELKVDLPAQEAHLLPQSALTLDDDGRLGVRLAEDGVARFHPVSILRDAAEGIWVAGLPDVAEVIVVGQEFVRSGRRVTTTPASTGQMR